MKKKFRLYGYSSPTDGTWSLDGTIIDEGEDFRTKVRYEEYKNCGFNTLLLQGNDPYDGEDFETSQLKKNMDNAYDAGLHDIIVYDRRLYVCSQVVGGLIGEDKMFPTEQDLENFIRDCIKDYKKHPGFGGFMLVDEPRYDQFRSIGQIMRATRKIDENIFVQCNLLPYAHGSGNAYTVNGAEKNVEDSYKEYLMQFLDETQAEYLMFDSYPMRKEDELGYLLLHSHIKAVEIVADFAKEHKKEFYFVCQTTAMWLGEKQKFRICDEADMRWQINCALMFGVHSLACFTYWNKQVNRTDGEMFLDGSAMISRNGERNPLYYHVQKIQKRMQPLLPFFENLQYENSTYYCTLSNLPKVLQEVQQRKLRALKDVQIEGKGSLLVTELKNLATGDEVLAFMNANDPKGEWGDLTITATYVGTAYGYISLKEDEKEVSLHNFTLAPGDGLFIKIKN